MKLSSLHRLTSTSLIFFACSAVPAIIFITAPRAHAADAEPPIDPVRRRALMQKAISVETLTAGEHACLDGVKKTTALLLNFFKTNDGASRWFRKVGEPAKLLPLRK